MQTQNIISTITVARVGTLEVVRTIDFQRLADESEDGKVSVEALTNGGDWGVKVTPVGKGESVLHDVDNGDEASAWVEGFCAAVDLKAKGTRADKDYSDSPDPTSREEMDGAGWPKKRLAHVAGKFDIDVKQNDTKSDVADNIAKFLDLE